QAEEGIRYRNVTGVQTCALPIFSFSLLVGFVFALPTVIVKLPTGIQEEKPVTPNENQEEASIDMSEETVEVSIKRTESDEVEKVPVEQYVISVVASEMPADYNEEALKAQAVAARTYIIQHLNQQDDPETIITDSTEHQVYKNETELQEQWGKDFEEKMNKIKSAVLATEGEV